MQVLTSTQTEGDPFTVKGGRYQITVGDWAADVTLQIKLRNSDPEAWIGTGETWTGDAPRVMWLAALEEYRLVTATAGAEAYLAAIGRFEYI